LKNKQNTYATTPTTSEIKCSKYFYNRCK